MRNILIDAGPLIALFDNQDGFHKRSVTFLREAKGTLWTTWPVVAETSHMLGFDVSIQIDFLEWVRRGGLQLFDLKATHLSRLIELSRKFKDVPMDLADASLIVASEELKITKIATIDSDFYVYRDVRNQYLSNVFM